MNNFVDSHYLFFNVKVENRFSFIEETEPDLIVKEADQYFIRISSSKEENHGSGLESGQLKIFVIRSENEIPYVGYASETMYPCITKGLAASMAKEYMKDGEFETKELDLYIFEFLLFADFSKTETRQYYQSIQSELIYLIKAETGTWPILQKQINLWNENQEEAREIAYEMILILKS